MANINAALVIPSLNPDEKIIRVIESAMAAGFQKIILVDDGSDAAHKQYFQRLAAHSEVTLLTHPQNRGKGEGLKTAFRYYRENCATAFGGVVTADGDGQHTTEDIVHCANEMLRLDHIIFGCRDFSSPAVPPKSRFGNKTTSAIFKLACGMIISDTQTGLRAIPNEYMDAMIATGGSRFEYETNMILEIKRLGLPLTEVTIETVYEDNNSGTHFRPVHDSVRIYKLIIRFMLTHESKLGHIIKYGCSSVVCFLVEFAIYYLALQLITQTFFEASLIFRFQTAIVYASSRICSSVLNFTLNRYLVFRSRDKLGASILKYYALCIPQMLVSASLVNLLSFLFETTAPALNTLLKLIVDVCIFTLSFLIQRKWVFKNRT